jgi:hypothetical protein
MLLNEQSSNAGPVTLNYVASAESGPPRSLEHWGLLRELGVTFLFPHAALGLSGR